MAARELHHRFHCRADEHARVHLHRLHRRRDAAQRGGSLSTSVDQPAAEPPSSSLFRSPRSLGRLARIVGWRFSLRCRPRGPDGRTLEFHTFGFDLRLGPRVAAFAERVWHPRVEHDGIKHVDAVLHLRSEAGMAFGKGEDPLGHLQGAADGAGVGARAQPVDHGYSATCARSGSGRK
jgi:hypothetical protein